MAAGKFGSFVGRMMTKAQKEGTRSGPSDVAEKVKLAEVGRMKKTELEKIASNPDSDYYMAAKRELKRREDVRTGTDSKAVRAMGREKATGTKEIREAAERSVEERKMLGMAKGGSVKGFKPCPGCPTPAKCKAAGKCMMKEKAKMPSKGSKKAATGMLVIPVKMSKAPAKKGKKG